LTEKSEQLIKRLTQMTEWVIDPDIPLSERPNVQNIIHESVQELKKERNNMSKEDRINAHLQLTLLQSIMKSALKLQ
jgi:hypothetical protein